MTSIPEHDLTSQTQNCLSVLASTLAALGEDKPKSRRRDRRTPQAFWSVDVPRAKEFVPHVLAYARNGERIVVKFVSVGIQGQPEATPDGLRVLFDAQIHLPQAGTPKAIPYPDEQVKALCLGEWATFGRVQVQMDPQHLLPRVTPEGNGCVAKWATPIRVRTKSRLLRWLSLNVHGLRIDENGGEFEYSGNLGWALPKLVWV